MDNDALFCEEEHKHHLLYSGTQVLQVRGAEELPALVIKTGKNTAHCCVAIIRFVHIIFIHIY